MSGNPSVNPYVLGPLRRVVIPSAIRSARTGFPGSQKDTGGERRCSQPPWKPAWFSLSWGVSERVFTSFPLFGRWDSCQKGWNMPINQGVADIPDMLTVILPVSRWEWGQKPRIIPYTPAHSCQTENNCPFPDINLRHPSE